MKAISQGVAFELFLQTVTLKENKINPDNIYLFRCYHCGTGISKIKGEIVSIVAGHVPSSEITVIIQCHICKENYSFQTLTTNNERKATKLILAPQSNIQTSTFRCILCSCLRFGEIYKWGWGCRCRGNRSSPIFLSLVQKGQPG